METNSKHISNDYLVLEYQKGNKLALKILIRQFHPRLKEQIYIQTRDKASLDDLVQESWYGIIKGLNTVEIRINFEVWALSIARRKAIDWIRKQQQIRKRMVALVNEESNLVSIKEEELDHQIVRKQKLKEAILELVPTQSIVLSMFYLDNYSINEISEILKISEGTVKSRLFNAREHLKKILINT